MRKFSLVLAVAVVVFQVSLALALEFGGTIGDIEIFEGKVYLSTKLSDNATDGDVFLVALENDQPKVVSSLRTKGYPKWDSFSKLAFLGQFGYTLTEYYNSCGAVFDTALAYQGELNCQVGANGLSVASGQGKIFLGWGVSPNFYIQIFVPLAKGELDARTAILPGGEPEKLFFQDENGYLFSVMGEAGIGIWSLENQELWKMGARNVFFSKDEYTTYTKAVDVVADGRYVYALASDRFGWTGVLAIIDLPAYNYNSNWFQFANQVGTLDISGCPLFVKKSGDRVCVGTSEEILLVDVSDPTTPKLVRKIACVSQDAEFFEGNLFLAKGNSLEFVLWDEALPGDISADGKVDLEDANLALQVLSGQTPSVKKENSLTGKVGLPDAIHALQTAAGLK